MAEPMATSTGDAREAVAQDARLDELQRQELHHYQLVTNEKGKTFYSNRQIRPAKEPSTDNNDGDLDLYEGPDGDLAASAPSSSDNAASDADETAGKKKRRKRRGKRKSAKKPAIRDEYLVGTEEHGSNIAMVAFVTPTVGQDCEGPLMTTQLKLSDRYPKSAHVKIIAAPAISPPSTVFGAASLAAHYEQQPEAEEPTWPPSAADLHTMASQKAAGTLTTLDKEGVLRCYWNFRSRYPKLFGGTLGPDLLNRFLFELWRIGFDAKLEDLRIWLNSKANVVSIGRLPSTPMDILQEGTAASQRAEILALGDPNEKEDYGKRDKDADSERDRIEKAKRAKRYIPPQRLLNVHERFRAIEKPTLDEEGRPRIEQNENVSAHVLTTKLPRFFSKIIVAIRFNYKDPSRPYLQPSMSTDIEFNADNCRPEQARAKNNGDYEPSHTFRVVRHVDDLEGLYPHLSYSELGDIIHSTTDEQELVLLKLCHNSIPATSNLFTTDRASCPEAHTAVRIAMRNSPLVYILVRTHPGAFRTRVNNVIEEFKFLAHYDPTLRFFTDPEKSTPSIKNVKPFDQWDRWTVRPNMYFSNAETMVRWMGLGTVGDLLFDAQKSKPCKGEAVILPIPGTQMAAIAPSEPVPRSTAYVMSIELERSEDRPRWQENDALTLEMGHLAPGEAPVQRDIAWAGFIKNASEFGSMDRLIAIVFRKTDGSGTSFVTDAEIATVPTSVVKDVSEPTAYRQVFRKGKTTPVTLRGTHDETIAKSELKHLNRVIATRRQLSSGCDAMLYEQHQALLKFFMGTDYEQMPLVPIFEGIPEDERHNAIAALSAFCSKTQREEFANRAVTVGSPMNIHVLTGAPGTGKTRLCHHVLSQYVRFGGSLRQDVHDRKRHVMESYETNGKIDDAYKVMEDQFPESPMTVHTTRPQVLVMAEQNKTVNELAHDSYRIYSQACETGGSTKKVLVIRLFSERLQTRLAVLEYKHRMHNKGDRDQSRYLDPSSDFDPHHPLLQALLRHEHPTDNDDLRDDRFTFNVRPFTIGNYVAQIFEMLPMSVELASKFTAEELEDFRSNTPNLVEAMAELGGDTTTPVDATVLKVAGKAIVHILKEIIRRCDVVVTTYALAGNTLLRGCFSPYALHFEEMTRAPESRLLAILAAHPFVQLTILNGDHKQNKFISFGDRRLPPVSQRETSLLQRLIYNGFPVYSLIHTHRFKNADLLEIVRIANPGREINPAPGCYDGLQEQIKAYNFERYGVNSTVVMIHLPKAYDLISMDANRSSYCVPLVIAFCCELKAMVVAFQIGRMFVAQTPYLATLALCRLYWESLMEASSQDEQTYMSLVEFVTVDANMGRESSVSWLDALVNGHLWDPLRTNVALSRPMHAITIFTDTERNTVIQKRGIVQPKSIMRQLTLHCKNKGLVYVMTDERLGAMPKFPHLFENAGVSTSTLDFDTHIVNTVAPRQVFQPEDTFHELSKEHVDLNADVQRRIYELSQAKIMDNTSTSEIEAFKDYLKEEDPEVEATNDSKENEESEAKVTELDLDFDFNNFGGVNEDTEATVMADTLDVTAEERQAFKEHTLEHNYKLVISDNQSLYVGEALARKGDSCHHCRNDAPDSITECWACQQVYCSVTCATKDMNTPCDCGHGPQCTAEKQLLHWVQKQRQEKPADAFVDNDEGPDGWDCQPDTQTDGWDCQPDTQTDGWDCQPDTQTDGW